MTGWNQHGDGRLGLLLMAGLGCLLLAAGIAGCSTTAEVSQPETTSVDQPVLTEAEVSAPETKSVDEPALTDLNDVSELQAAFNEAAGVPRLILLLSPT